MRVLFFGLIVLLIAGCKSRNAPVKPNIILIMADDLGYETLGVNGGLEYPTPNLDKMAAEGMRFTNFHSTPLCTPSRVQIMTGKYNDENYIGFGLLSSKEKTFAHYLKEEGYRTAVTGKWQLYGNDYQQKLAGGTVGSMPQQAGFDQWCLWQVNDRGERYRDPKLDINGEVREFPGRYGPDLFLDFSTQFIEANKDSSFFLYYPMVLVHDPFEPTPDASDFDDFQRPMNDTTRFADMVKYMDYVVGSILNKVSEVGIEDNTIIIFLGDNGTDRDVVTDHISGAVHGRKGHTVEAGTHVPFIAYGSKVTNGTYEGLADLTDILPTILDLTGVDEAESTEGNSLVSVFNGDTTSIREWIYCYYHPNWGQFKPSEYVFDKEYKLYADGTLYNYRKDPEEETPVDTSRIQEIAAYSKLKLVLTARQQKRSDKIPDPIR